MLLAALLSLAALDPQVSEAVSRAAALEAGQNPRFDVVSELDVQEMAEFEAQKQLCGATAESCASQLAGAYDARLVLFLSLYMVGVEPHAQLTFRDLRSDVVIHRADAAGVDEKALFDAVRIQVRETLGRFSDFPAEGRVRLFVSRAATSIVQPTREGAPAPSAAADAQQSPSFLLVGGGAAAGVGAIVAASGLIVGLVANAVVADENALRKAKDDAQGTRTVGYVGASVGAVALVSGLLMMSIEVLQ